MIRLAVLRFGDEWSVQAQDRRIGHFEQPESALRAGFVLAREAAYEGHEVELLVQDRFGALERFSPADATPGSTPEPARFHIDA